MDGQNPNPAPLCNHTGESSQSPGFFTWCRISSIHSMGFWALAANPLLFGVQNGRRQATALVRSSPEGRMDLFQVLSARSWSLSLGGCSPQTLSLNPNPRWQGTPPFNQPVLRFRPTEGLGLDRPGVHAVHLGVLCGGRAAFTAQDRPEMGSSPEVSGFRPGAWWFSVWLPWFPFRIIPKAGTLAKDEPPMQVVQNPSRLCELGDVLESHVLNFSGIIPPCLNPGNALEF